MVMDPEAQKRPSPDSVGEEQPSKFQTLPWQAASLGTPPPLAAVAGFNTPTSVGGRGRSVGTGLPDDPISPGPGAGLEEIRVWSQRSALRIEGQQRTFLQ